MTVCRVQLGSTVADLRQAMEVFQHLSNAQQVTFVRPSQSLSQLVTVSVIGNHREIIQCQSVRWAIDVQLGRPRLNPVQKVHFLTRVRLKNVDPAAKVTSVTLPPKRKSSALRGLFVQLKLEARYRVHLELMVLIAASAQLVPKANIVNIRSILLLGRLD